MSTDGEIHKILWVECLKYWIVACNTPTVYPYLMFKDYFEPQDSMSVRNKFSYDMFMKPPSLIDSNVARFWDSMTIFFVRDR